MYRSVTLMGYRVTGSKCLTVCLGFTFVMGCFLASLPITSEKENLQISTSKKKLAILVPFRDRFEELLEFVPHMHQFLTKQSIPYHIFIIQQKDTNRFNRASLINVGFLYTKQNYDYIAMHDVDLLPMNNDLKYDYPKDGVFHISSPQTHPKYHYSTFIGGILLINREDFELVNGMSNNYWGWGLEDDEFYVRLKDAGIAVRRPANISTGTENTFKDSLHPGEGHRLLLIPEIKDFPLDFSHPKYHYSTFIGGILLINREDFELVNGMSNNYWGWWLEDDEFYVRLKDAGIAVRRPANISTGTENTFKHVHDKTYRKRDMRKCFNQRDVTRRRDKVTGVHDVAYKIHSTHNVTIDSLPVTVVNVELICDKRVTPWCQCPEPVKVKKS